MQNINLKNFKTIYEKGENIINAVNNHLQTTMNDELSILLSYDLQSGSYINNLKKKNYYSFHQLYTQAIANIINTLSYNSIIEIGVGEATTFTGVLKKISVQPSIALGFDISYSRILLANQYLALNKINYSKLFTSSLFNIPIKDNSIDVVYTSHSIEPNGGREKEALAELYRITKKYLILLEPIYEFATPIGKKRMESLGYIKNLYEIAQRMNFNITEYRPFKYSINKLNPTGLIIIEKKQEESTKYLPNQSLFIDPISKKEMVEYPDCYYCPESYLLYPKIQNIPCLLPQNAIPSFAFSQAFDWQNIPLPLTI